MSNSDPFYCLGEEYLIHFHDKCHKLELWHAKSERLICSVDIRYINGGSSAEAMNVTKNSVILLVNSQKFVECYINEVPVKHDLAFRSSLRQACEIKVQDNMLVLAFTKLNIFSLVERKACLSACADFVRNVIGYEDLIIQIDDQAREITITEKNDEVFQQITALLESLTGQQRLLQQSGYYQMGNA